MKSSYTFIDHTADVLFIAKAPSLAKLFEQCALALEDTQVELDKIEHKKDRLKWLELNGLIHSYNII